MGGHYTTAASQPAVMTREHLESCRHLLGDVPEWVEREADIRSVESRNMAERKIVGPTRKGAQNESTGKYGAWGDGITPTAPATDARQWSGWGTALKPAYEPIIVARKPLMRHRGRERAGAWHGRDQRGWVQGGDGGVVKKGHRQLDAIRKRNNVEHQRNS
jgi:hypothetical protein